MTLLQNYLRGVRIRVTKSKSLSSTRSKKNMRTLTGYSFVIKVLIDFEVVLNPFIYMRIMKMNSAASWTHVKEIPGTKLLISLHHSYMKSAQTLKFSTSRRKEDQQKFIRSMKLLDVNLSLQIIYTNILTNSLFDIDIKKY